MSVETATTTRRYGITPPGYRLPDATHLGRVTLQIAELERSLDYYTRVLGFEVLERGEGRALLGASGDGSALIELRERRGVAPVPRSGLQGLYHFAILLPDRAALGRFVGHLAEVDVRAGAADHLVSEALYLQDPDGLGIEVYSDRPRESWEVDADELRMTTDPLNLREVLAAGGGEPWAGMPAGTTLGHVHLHVGDLNEAARFYHAALGLDKVVWSYPGALFLSAGGYHHHLGLNTWARGARAADEGDARLLEWEMVLPAATDLAEAAASLEAAGWGVRKESASWVASDPWGTTIRVSAGAGSSV
jgi:catechol 2,3-dioxygenase